MEKLIACIKKYPCLYDMEDEMYKNTTLKAEIWDAIAIELNESADILKTKWKNLRDNYVRYRKVKGGGTREPSRKHKWRWFGQLQFLDCTLDSHSTTSDVAQTSSNATLAQAVVSNESSSSHAIPMQPTASASTSCAPPVIAPKAVKRPKRIHTPGELEEETDYQKVKNLPKLDAIDHLFQSYADTFKKFSEKNKIMLKLEMAKLFADTEFKELDERSQPVYSAGYSVTYNPVSPCYHSSSAHCDHQSGSHASAESSTPIDDIKFETYQCHPSPSRNSQ